MPASIQKIILRIGSWPRPRRLPRVVALVLSTLAVISGALTYAVMTGWAPVDPSSSALFVLLNIDLALLLILAALIARALVRLWSARRSGSAGSRLRLRFVGLFSVLTVIPAILMAVFSALFFDLGVQTWFGTRVQTALTASQAVAQAYLKEHQQMIGGQVLSVASDVERNWGQIIQNPERINEFLETQILLRGLTEAIVFDSTGKVWGRAGYTFALQFEEVPYWALDKAESGDVVVLTGETEDRVRALRKLNIIPTAYLYVGRFVDPGVIQYIANTDQAVEDYLYLLKGRSHLVVRFTLIFIVVALLLLMVAVWEGVNLANWLAHPIGELIDAAEKVSGGNLDARVSEPPSGDEISVLSRSFNRMTQRLGVQQRELLTANRELAERSRFIETVLAGVSAGIISVSPERTIILANRAATVFLGIAGESLVGRQIRDLLPEFSELCDLARNWGEQAVQREIVYHRGNASLSLRVAATAEFLGGELIGYVLTFDDMTALLAAQRAAAWADVARRIAHEIKNPLTPIQLSAERLKRKYLKQITTDPDVFVQCTDTIVRHVSDIGQMVDEFSSFARMPRPEMRLEKLDDLIRQAVFFQHTAYAHIAFSCDLPSSPVPMVCDRRHISQALTNLLKNSVEAIEGREDDARPGRIVVKLQEKKTESGHRSIEVSVTDNGKGLPPKNRSRLIEPYVTTRAKGTGLGLAIVKKIMEDHNGDLLLEDAPKDASSAAAEGARVSMIFKVSQKQTLSPSEEALHDA